MTTVDPSPTAMYAGQCLPFEAKKLH